ncbi:uncharacterized protein LOC123550847 isoform X2 [Mercenaria mercenaria]|uniref:uncharacterized protein LOC123550847 isoform X2 n=1 Tax=Mercenaria mercenaria TaxID=6596 RepID=UPI00234F10E4|nr:uncharacterized protein LOC123550847 isoform X2 [Mercenaria mercenaria]
MVSWLLEVCTFITLVAGAVGTHLDPDCPRHRGLPDGFPRTENRIRDRALYRLDLRSAIKGFIPEKEYRFRVQTTARKYKFNDATVTIDAVDERCGTGSWVTDTDELYSPQGCPSIVTTQQKQPMGRAHFKWKAPSCGCVHFRVRVHANATYYIEDETVRNGPLARTICPRAGTVKEPVTTVPTTTTSVLPKVLTRNERLLLLCDVTTEHKVEDVLKNDDFMSKRTMSRLSSFELERLHIAVERRHLEILSCCNLDTELDKFECFGDIRRVKIDTFCGSGESDIPLTKTRYDWIKQKQPECCPQIGEARYRCFNHTLHEEDMLKDGHAHHSSIDMDDFDPVNYVEDYPQAEEIRTKFSKIIDQTTKMVPEKSETNHKVQYKNVEESQVVKSQNNGSDTNIDDDDNHNDDGDDDDDKRNQADKHKDDSANSKEKHDGEGDNDANDEMSDETKEDAAENRSLSIEECCMNGIDAGTRVAAEGFDGCFRMADKFDSYFTNWHRKCDRHFVVCCMRVIDGLSSTKRSLV